MNTFIIIFIISNKQGHVYDDASIIIIDIIDIFLQLKYIYKKMKKHIEISRILFLIRYFYTHFGLKVDNSSFSSTFLFFFTFYITIFTWSKKQKQ